MIKRCFYQELGKLLYAIANIDGKIQERERETLKKITKSVLHSHKTGNKPDSFASFYIELEFGMYEHQGASVSSSYHSFIDFVNKNKKHINDKMKIHAIALTEKVAAAFKGVNKAEKKLLIGLKKELEKNLKI